MSDSAESAAPKGNAVSGPRLPEIGIQPLVLSVLVFAGILAGTSPTHAQTTEPPATNVQQEGGVVSEPGTAAPMERKLLKVLPDVRLLKGTPNTILELGSQFEEAATADCPLQIAIIYNSKPKVVAAQVKANKYLILETGAIGTTEIIIEARADACGRQWHTKFQAEVWEPDYWKLVLTVIGGLGVFLLGMRNMSEGLQAVAGPSLRRMIGAVTDNRLLATGVGTLVTMLIQSSSITTVMVVGFINSGFMTLTQGVGVIMGANIGTTITGWILVLKIGKYGLPMVGVGAFGYLFSKRDNIRYVAMTVMGLGMIFLGLELMKDGFSILKDLPAFEAWFAEFRATTYPGVLKCALAGCILTFLVQSSSATLGITIGLAQIGVIPLETAAALVLGENIGTTVTAWLASFGTTTNAKRAAYFHILFNMIGVFWITAVFQWYIVLIRSIVGGASGETSVTAAIAATHTLFNVANTLLFLPFGGKVARWLERVVPEKEVALQPRLTNLDVRMLETPVIAVEQSRDEILRIADGCRHMLAGLREVLSSEIPDESLTQRVLHQENEIDGRQHEIVEFMSNLLSANVPHSVTDEIRRQLRMADEYESVSDSVATVAKAYRKLHKHQLLLPDEERRNVLELHDMVADYFARVTAAYRENKQDIVADAKSRGDAITKHVKRLGNLFLNRTMANSFESPLDPRVSVAYNRQITAYRRVRDHTLNIAEAIGGAK